MNPAFDPEVLGGDTCALGECCMNPFGFLFSRIIKYHDQHQCQKKEGDTQSSSTTPAEIVYILGCYGGWSLIFFHVYPLIAKSNQVPNTHKLVGYVVLMACISSWRLAKMTSPGSITAETLHIYDNYAYDNVLYFNRVCPTKHIRKLARSKFDRYSGDHVPRYDHFCPVLNRTIGEENYRFFLVFLLVHCTMCWYGCAIVIRLVWEQSALSKGDGDVRTPLSSAFSSSESFFSWKGHHALFAVILGLCGAGLIAFLSFHVYLICCGMTTNEFYKYKSVSTSELRNDEEEMATPTSVHAPIRLHRARANSFYHLGISGNFYEVVYPRCQRQGRRTKKRL
eukprot:scaffold7551_cov168-Amphora_coffeaeformis.AAC.1